MTIRIPLTSGQRTRLIEAVNADDSIVFVGKYVFPKANNSYFAPGILYLDELILYENLPNHIEGMRQASDKLRALCASL